MDQPNLIPREILGTIEKYISTPDVIVLHGARQVGKTSILRIIERNAQHRGSPTFYLDLEDSRLVSLLNQGVEAFLSFLAEKGMDDKKKKTIVFIDEIQYLGNPSSFLKRIADHHNNIKLIVSGSSSFNIKKKFKNSLVGRTVSFEVWPLSFQEFLLFTKTPVTLSPVKSVTEPTRHMLVEKYREYCLYGGYPKIALTKNVEMKEKYLQQIIDTYIRKDIRDIGNIRSLDKFNKLVETLSSQSGSLINVKELSNTCDLSAQTINEYLFLLEETYIITQVRPWSSNIRSELFKTPKIYMNDTGLMQLLWLKSLQKEVLGSVLETSVFSELTKKYGRKNIHYWRTKDKQEIDFILREGNETTSIEVKLNFARFKEKPFEIFEKRYHIKKKFFIALDGQRTRSIDKYPWEL